MSGRIHVVVGGQYGSEGKGALCARLADSLAPNSMVIRTGGPNAGHTAYDLQGNRHQLRMLGTPVVRRADIWAALAPRAVVDLDVLGDECQRLSRNVYVDPNATILTADDIKAEQDPESLNTGSTRKGIGAARKRRLDRVGPIARDWVGMGEQLPSRVVAHESVPDLARAVLRQGGDVIVEGAQGYGLGLHTDSYPHTTSGDCTVMDALTDCHFTLADLNEFEISPWVVLRPFPIRIAGASGPLKGETTWRDLGLPEEYTTVTKKVRRVGDWDADLARDAILSAAGDRTNVCLTMVDQVFPEVAGLTNMAQLEALPDAGFWDKFSPWLRKLRESTDTNFTIDAIGTGPETMILVRESIDQYLRAGANR